MGQITDAAVFSCVPYTQTTGAHQCLILTNPYQGTAKIFDVTDNQFVLSPIGYFPLVVKVGQAPSKMAAINNRIFTLDPVAQAIYEIPTSFVSPFSNNPIPVGFSANDFALATDAQGKIVAFVSRTEGLTQIALEGQALPQGFSLPGPIDLFEINLTRSFLLVAHGTTLTVVDLLHADAQKTLSLTASVASMTSDSTKALLALTDKTLIMVDLANAKIESTAPAKLDAIAGAVYLPSNLPGTPSTCCNGEASWVGALLMNGTLQYWPYANQTFKTPQSVDIVLTTGVGSFALTNPTKLLGGDVQNPVQDGLSCERRLFLIYSGSIFNTCEGNSNIKRVDQMEY